MNADERLALEAIDLLKKHDQTFEYSDDHRVWLTGTAEKNAILKRLNYLPLELALSLVDKYITEPEIKERWRELVKTHSFGLGPG